MKKELKIKELTMTEGEILRSFKEAKDPLKQVKILAELNDCPVEVIKMILKRQGVDGRTLPRAGKGERVAVENKPENNSERSEGTLSGFEVYGDAAKQKPEDVAPQVEPAEEGVDGVADAQCTPQGVALGVYGAEIRNNVRAMIQKTAERKAELESRMEGLRRDLAECDVILYNLTKLEEGLAS